MRVWVFYIHFLFSKSFNNGSHGNHDTATTQHTHKNTMDVSKNTPNTLFAMRACFICLKQVLFKYIYLNIYKYCFLLKRRILSFKHHTVWFIHIDTYIWFNQEKKHDVLSSFKSLFDCCSFRFCLWFTHKDKPTIHTQQWQRQSY